MRTKTKEELALLSDMQVEDYWLDLEANGLASLVDGKFQVVE